MTKKKDTKETSPAPDLPKKGGKGKGNLIFALLLLVVASGLYLHHKGYLDSLKSYMEDQLFSKPALSGAAQDMKSYESDVAQKTLERTKESVEISERFEILDHKIQDLEAKILKVKTAQAENNISQIPMDRRWIKVFLLVQALENRIMQGLPFTIALKPLKSIIPVESYESLAAMSDFGSPSLIHLKKGLKGVLRTLRSEKDLQEAETFLDSVRAHLKQLVRFEKAKPSVDLNDPFYNIAELVRRGELARAIVEVENYKSKDPRVKMWLSHASAYVKTHDILEKIKSRFVETTS